MKLTFICVITIITFILSGCNPQIGPSSQSTDSSNTQSSQDLALKTPSSINLVGVATSSGLSEFNDGDSLLVMGHLDDELLWMMPLWPYADKVILAGYPYRKETYSRICMPYANPPGQYPLSFQQKFIGSLWSDSANFFKIYLNPSDNCTRSSILTFDELKKKLRPHFTTNIKRVFTHNNWGEYGHIHHRMINQAIRELAVEFKKDVWMLGVLVTGNAESRNYQNVTAGLSSVSATFNHNDFVFYRGLFQNTLFDQRVDTNGDGIGDSYLDTWTWDNSTYAYPHGTRYYLKAVDKGVDKTIGNAIITTYGNQANLEGACTTGNTSLHGQMMVAANPNTGAILSTTPTTCSAPFNCSARPPTCPTGSSRVGTGLRPEASASYQIYSCVRNGTSPSNEIGRLEGLMSLPSSSNGSPTGAPRNFCTKPFNCSLNIPTCPSGYTRTSTGLRKESDGKNFQFYSCIRQTDDKFHHQDKTLRGTLYLSANPNTGALLTTTPARCEKPFDCSARPPVCPTGNKRVGIGLRKESTASYQVYTCISESSILVNN